MKTARYCVHFSFNYTLEGVTRPQIEGQLFVCTKKKHNKHAPVDLNMFHL